MKYNKVKKIMAIALSSCVVVGSLAGCGTSSVNDNDTTDESANEADVSALAFDMDKWS